MNNKKILNLVNEINNIIDNNIDSLKLNLDLLGGITGAYLFKIHYIKYIQKASLDLRAEELLYPVVNLKKFISKVNSPANYCLGMGSILWYIKYLNDNDIIEFDCNEIISEIKEYLIEEIIKCIKDDNLDFFYGAGGILFILNKYNILNENDILLIENLIIEKIIYIDDTTASFYMKFNDNKDKYNIGMPHGLCSWLTVLSGMKTTNLKIINSVKHCLNFIEKTKSINHSLSLYPYTVNRNNPFSNNINNSRLAWCYGDISVALCYWNCALNLQITEFKEKAIDILKLTTNRIDLKENQIFDAGFCHGSSGVAHIYNRFYLETGEKIFDDASKYWIEETIKFSIHKDGLAGFKSYKGNLGLVNDLTVLEGISGIGLVLISYLYGESDNSNWDNCFLIN